MRRITRCAAALLVTALLPLGYVSPASATDNGRIVFLYAYGTGAVGIVDASAGATDTPIGPVLTGRPAFSPDGARVLAVTPGGEVVTFRTDGTGLATIATGATNAHYTPAWSPDANRVAYWAGGFAPPFELRIVDSVPGGTPQTVATVNAYPDSMSWSPSGDVILFASGDGTVFRVVASPGAAAEQVPLPTPGGVSNTGVSWSPDGSRFSFARDCVDPSCAGSVGVWTANADGSGAVQLAATDDRVLGTSWSPDGTRIAFGVQPIGGGWIKTINSTGTGQTGTTITGADASGIGFPSWGPTPQVPVAATRPTVSGTVAVGSVLTATRGQWSFTPTTTTVKWQLCAPGTPATCTDIAGATGDTFTPGSAQIGAALRVVVTATNLVGPATAASDLTAVVPQPSVDPPPGPAPEPEAAPVAGSVVPKTLRAVKGKTVAVPCATTSREDVTACAVVMRTQERLLRARSIVIGRGSATGPDGGAAKLVTRVQLNAKGRALVKRRPTARIRLTITVTAVPADSPDATAMSTLALTRKLT